MEEALLFSIYLITFLIILMAIIIRLFLTCVVLKLSYELVILFINNFIKKDKKD